MKNILNTSIRSLLIILISLLFSCASTQQKQNESRDAEFYNNRGADYFEKGQYDQAISDFTKALDINPRYAGAYYNRGFGYFEKREYEKSWRDIEKAQSLGFQIRPKFLDELRKASRRQN